MLVAATVENKKDRDVEVKGPLANRVNSSETLQSMLEACSKSAAERPLFHITSPWGWLNDPCAPYYNHNTQTYHVFYQWNPKQTVWGNTSWGECSSKDLIHWTRPCLKPVLEPSVSYDHKGVFTGCIVKHNNDYILYYTSVSSLPIHYTRDYDYGCETLSVAITSNNGKSWERIPANPILPGPPKDLVALAWRDPYVSSWPAMDTILNIEKGTGIYGIISGGIKDVTPTPFLYILDPKDPLKWTYICPLVDVGTYFQPHPKWTGDYGVNWEVTNFMSLKSNKTGKMVDFLVAGCEGGYRKVPMVPNPTTARWTLWMAGELNLVKGKPRMEYTYGGIFDHGNLYAVNTFHDPVKNRRIAWGWITEEDIPESRLQEQGYNGCLSLPREIFLYELENVVSACVSPIEDIACVRRVGNNHTIQTLGMRPIDAESMWRMTIPVVNTYTSSIINATRFKFTANIKIGSGCQKAGVTIRHTPNKSLATHIYFSPKTEQIVVDRSKSSESNNVNKENISGPFTLFTFGSGEQETLSLTVYCDNNVLEIFANDRFAISTRIYPDNNDATGISLYSEGTGEALFDNAFIHID